MFDGNITISIHNVFKQNNKYLISKFRDFTGNKRLNKKTNKRRGRVFKSEASNGLSLRVFLNTLSN